MGFVCACILLGVSSLACTNNLSFYFYFYFFANYKFLLYTYLASNEKILVRLLS